jgi:hypothetical protein
MQFYLQVFFESLYCSSSVVVFMPKPNNALSRQSLGTFGAAFVDFKVLHQRGHGYKLVHLNLLKARGG